jgi:hypothetical protein
VPRLPELGRPGGALRRRRPHRLVVLRRGRGRGRFLARRRAGLCAHLLLDRRHLLLLLTSSRLLSLKISGHSD